MKIIKYLNIGLLTLLLTACGGGSKGTTAGGGDSSAVDANGTSGGGSDSNGSGNKVHRDTMLLELSTLKTGSEPWITDGTTQGTKIIKDINTTKASVNAGFVVNMDGVIYFSAFDEVAGQELWRSDGTQEGTYMVKDIWEGSTSSRPEGMIVFHGALYFSAKDKDGLKLFKSDGTTAGTVMVSDKFKDIRIRYDYEKKDAINDGNQGSFFFTAEDKEKGFVLAKSNGTTEGTKIVKDLYPEERGEIGDIRWFKYFNGKVFFTGLDANRDKKVAWVSDGTEEGTYVLDGLALTNLYQSIYNHVVGDFIYYYGPFTGLWKTDGTNAGTELVQDFYALASFENIGDKVYFWAKDSKDSNYVLWKNDGSNDGTQKVLNQEFFQTFMHKSFNDTLYFSVRGSYSEKKKLWKSDGTNSGTKEVGEVHYYSFMEPALGELFYDVKDINKQYELWKIDNMGNKTMIRDGFTARLHYVLSTDKFIYFTDYESQLWKSDGTKEGTVLVEPIPSGTNSSSPTELVQMNGIYYFVAHRGKELWRSDGTKEGTKLVKSIGDIENLYIINNTLYFSVNDTQLWKSDGTEEGTKMIKQLDSYESSSMTDANGILIFIGNENELWKSNGTEEGTEILLDMQDVNGSQQSLGYYLYKVGDIVYFDTYINYKKKFLWKTDGTKKGTHEAYSFLDTQSANNFTDVNGVLFFSVKNEDTNSSELWKLDRNESKPVMLKSHKYVHNTRHSDHFMNVNGELYYIALRGARDKNEGTELWKSDGTKEGTKFVANLGSFYQWLEDYIYFKGKVYFTMKSYFSNIWERIGLDPTGLGSELWVSDGTQEGTKVFKDIRTGKSSSDPKIRGIVNDELLFEATDDRGRKLWKTDGTVEGTKIIQEGLR